MEAGDITAVHTDVIVLKYARDFHGADLAVATLLIEGGLSAEALQPDVGERRLLRGLSRLGAPQVLMVGTPSLGQFRYAAIREFAYASLHHLAREAPDTTSVAFTIHGPGYGLDEGEALQSLVNGLLDAHGQRLTPRRLERVVVVEKRESRAYRLWQRLERTYAGRPDVERAAGQALRFVTGAPPPSAQAERVAEGKPHIFVAMPFSRPMDDVYYFGIEQPVHAMGYLCERVDQGAFTGHILDQIRERIDSATVVVADLTDANPNVYLEVGYAWGRGRPTILLVQDVKHLRFDVQSQRCLVYDRIIDLARLLTQELRRLQERGIIQVSG